MKKHIKISILFVSILLVVWALFCGPKTQQNTAPAVTAVKTVRVSLQEISVPIHASGILYAESQIKLSFKTGGIIEKIPVDEGETVQKGRLLATLMLDEIKARVEQAESALEKAERDYERITNLYADSVVTLEQKQNMETALQVARSDMKMASFNLKYSVIRAPATGKILKRLLEPNEMVDTGHPVFILGTTSDGWVVKTGLIDKEIVRVQLGDSAAVSFSPYPDKNFPGRVTEMAGAADPRQGTYEIEIGLDKTPQTLLPGFVAHIKILPDQRNAFYMVPIQALVEARGLHGYVYTVENGQAEKIPVTVGHIFKDKLGITRGLENVSSVITDGASLVTDGTPVQVIND